jgi:hypothetical protein
MLAVGNYRLVLHPDSDPFTLEAALSGDASSVHGVLQLTRITSSFDTRLLRLVEAGDEPRLSRQYVWQVSVKLMSDDVRYQFEQNIERLQAAVVDHATVLGVETYAAISEVG